MVTNLALRFILEICALASLGYWGFLTGKGYFLKILLGIGAPLLIAIIWGAFGSPGAPFPLKGTSSLMLEIFIFGIAAAALYHAGKPILALLFGVLVILNRVLMYVWHQ